VRIVRERPQGNALFPVPPPATAFQVAVVDDHSLVGRLVVGLLERAGFTACLAFGRTTESTWEELAEMRPQLVLLDFDLGRDQSSLDILRRAVRAGMTVAGFTGSDNRLEHAVLLEAGAAAVVAKGCGPADLVAVVELALAGQELMAPADRHEMLSRLRRHRAAVHARQARFSALTGREEEALRQLARGLSAAEIARSWQVAMPTVRSHIRSILIKLGVSSQLQAVARARDSGWYEASEDNSTSSILMMSNDGEAGKIARWRGSAG